MCPALCVYYYILFMSYYLLCNKMFCWLNIWIADIIVRHRTSIELNYMCIVVYYYMCTVLLTVDKGKRKGLQSRQGRLLLIFLFDGPCCWQMRQMYDTKTISVFDLSRFVLAFLTKHIDVCLQTESISLCVCEISYKRQWLLIAPKKLCRRKCRKY